MKKFTTRIPIGFILLFFLCFNSSAQRYSFQPKPDTVAVTGHLVRITPKLADIDPNTMYGKPLVITRDKDGIIGIGRNVERTEERVEEEMRKKINSEYLNAIKGIKTDLLQMPGREKTQKPGTQTIQNPGSITPTVPSTSLGANWEGGTTPGFTPTDNNAAASPTNVIQIVNDAAGSRFFIFTKTGTPVNPGGTTLASLTGFAGLGDPVVLYDQLADRWFMAEFGPGGSSQNWLTIAVSTTPSPTGTWKIYNFTDNTFFPDYPKYSVWHNAYYAYSNDFNTAGTSYLGSSVWAFDRTAMLAGAPTATMVRQRLVSPSNLIAMGTIGLEGMTPSSQNGLFLVPSAATTINMFEVTPDFVTPAITVGPIVPLTVNAWNVGPGSVAQQGTANTIATLSPRMMFKSSYRNNSGTESIVCTNTIAGSGGLAAVRWYELRRVAGNWTVYQQGDVTGADGNSRFMPGISMDGCGNIALMYDQSGTTAFPSIKYTGRNSFDPINTMTLPEATIINGTSSWAFGRWGDYNATVQDYSSAGVPVNGSFWTTSEYANQHTRIANFSITGGCSVGPSITAGATSLIAESCAPPNGAIDPTETVTVNFCLQNNGNANTSNLVATLLPTGGVTSPSGPQNYGVVVAGGASVCQPFTFSNTGICGGTITATLQLQDGAFNLGTISYTLTLGVPNTSTTLLPNGDFETGNLTSWTILSSNPAPVVNSTAPHTGTYAAFLGNLPGAEPLGDASIYQTITVPSNGGTLHFWYQGFTQDGISFDWQDAYITNTSGAILATIMHVCSTNPYTQVNYNLAAFAGQTVRVEFLVHQDGFGDVTNMYVDDVSVTSTTYTCCGIPPPCTLTCPANITVNNDAGQCGAVVNFVVTASGACGTVTSVPASGSFFPKGTTTVTSTSQAGATCTFTVTVNDTQLPTVTCPGNQTRSTNNNVCTYTAVGTEFNAVASDNCPGVTKAYTLTGATTGTGSTLAGVVFNKGVTTVTWVPTDAVSNVGANCSFTVTVNDTQLPNITCKANQTRNTPPATCTYTASGTEFDPSVLSDNCVTVTQAYTLSGATSGSGSTLAGKVFNIGVTTVTWTATDGSNNTSNCSFTVTIIDSNLPVITTQPANKTVCEGDNATFSVVATSPALITYQWQQWNGTAWVNIAGATASSYTVNSTTVAMNTNSYRCILTDICGGTVTSGFATLYVNKLPVITLTTSRSPALIPGQFLTITANVNPGGGTIVWRKNGVVIAGYNAFWIPNLTVDDIGTYDATYTDLNGCVKSSASVSITAKAYDKLFVYPNPNDGNFQVRFYNAPGQAVTVNIYDSKGAKVYQRGLVTGQLAYSRTDVNLSKLSAGVYVVDLLDASGNRLSSKRIIISH